ncbi:hypothetical protein D9615_007792 [Tricholomella constricta]|uniref:Serine/threonine-protein phosphatase 2A activator n=1 Tax=Tricholomella constricta TaxID=117010 RepID=A0A8H5M0F6_9AGAR|nr:hypothetical protein D9615_007792 [Tricholomella constricta]
MLCSPTCRQRPLEGVCAYFDEAWGSCTRIDYGSGMELNLLCCLLVLSIWICLERLGVTTEGNHKALVIRCSRQHRGHADLAVDVVVGICEVARRVGAQRLSFLAALYGTAQLTGRKDVYIRPKAIHDADVEDEYLKHYIYFACIKIKVTRSSSDQDCIATAALTHARPHLSVLSKLLVMQYFLFGSILPYTASSSFWANMSHEISDLNRYQRESLLLVHSFAPSLLLITDNILDIYPEKCMWWSSPSPSALSRLTPRFCSRRTHDDGSDLLLAPLNRLWRPQDSLQRRDLKGQGFEPGLALGLVPGLVETVQGRCERVVEIVPVLVQLTVKERERAGLLEMKVEEWGVGRDGSGEH